VRFVVVIAVVAACHRAPTAAEIADRGWEAHELVVASGEHAKTCAEAGTAMQRMFSEHRQAFVDALALDNAPDRLAEATAYLEAHQDRYADLEARMEALSERCETDQAVRAAFRLMEAP
jgi:hypothetical protein